VTAFSEIPYETALIVGAGPGISASFARALASRGIKVAVSARDPDRLQTLASEVGALALPADASDPVAVRDLFVQTEARIGVPEIVLYNASGRVRGSIVDLDPEAVRRAVNASIQGAPFDAGQEARARAAGWSFLLVFRNLRDHGFGGEEQ